MFVSDSNLFNPSSMKIRVCGLEGVDVILELTPDYTIDKVKLMAVTNLCDPTEATKLSLYHKLVNVRTGRVLNDDSTTSQEGLQDGDELLLLKKRPKPPPIVDPSKKDESKVGPTSEQVAKATESLSVINHDQHPSDDTTSIDFQSELRKILISLIDAAQKILCLNPEAAKIFKEAEQYLEEQNAGPKVNDTVVKQLVDMGFPEVRATKALILNKMSVSDAVQWLLEHEEDDDIDVPLPGMETSQSEEGATGGALPPSSPDSPLREGADGSPGAVGLAKVTGPNKVANMLESFKAFRRKNFRPNPRALSYLVELGFDEADASDALRIAGNKENEACEWLLSGNRRVADEDLEVGLEPESPLYKAILASPTVQLGLSNPRSLLAFLHMLENPGNTQQWLNDPDTGPMLIQISRIYHAEKHAAKISSSSSSSSSSSATEGSSSAAVSNSPSVSSSSSSSQQTPATSSSAGNPS